MCFLLEFTPSCIRIEADISKFNPKGARYLPHNLQKTRTTDSLQLSLPNSPTLYRAFSLTRQAAILDY